LLSSSEDFCSQRLKVIGQDEALAEPEPLPLNGKYFLLEMVEHSRQTGRLARAMGDK
tara:strand:- start:268 stop:438 length:171 start_codon:yes stop_codon:yes gene_type:complete